MSIKPEYFLKKQRKNRRVCYQIHFPICSLLLYTSHGNTRTAQNAYLKHGEKMKQINENQYKVYGC